MRVDTHNNGTPRILSGQRRSFPGPFKMGDMLAPYRGYAHRHISTASGSLDERMSALLAIESDLMNPHVRSMAYGLRYSINKQAGYLFFEKGPDLAYSLFEIFGDCKRAIETTAYGTSGDYTSLLHEIRSARDIIFSSGNQPKISFLGVPLVGQHHGQSTDYLGTIIFGTHKQQGRRNFIEDDVAIIRCFAEIASMVIVSSELGIDLNPKDFFAS